MPKTIPVVYEPNVDIPEGMCNILNDFKIGQQINNMIVNYTVIENTKNYIVLRIEFVYINMPRRY